MKGDKNEMQLDWAEQFLGQLSAEDSARGRMGMTERQSFNKRTTTSFGAEKSFGNKNRPAARVWNGSQSPG